MPMLVPLEQAIVALHDCLVALQTTVDPAQRIIVALAGAPGSGKSTISAKLLLHLANSGVSDVAVVPMDGYHYTKASLAKFADPVEAFKRRGAPFTFDGAAFVKAVRALRDVCVTAHDEPAVVVRLPGFDHTVQDPVPDDVVVPSSVRVLVIEGNYTLFNQQPWNAMADLADEKWYVDVPRDVAKHRLAKRHVLAGIEGTMEAAETRAEENDLPNGDLIRENLIIPDVIIDG